MVSVRGTRENVGAPAVAAAGGVAEQAAAGSPLGEDESATPQTVGGDDLMDAERGPGDGTTAGPGASPETSGPREATGGGATGEGESS